jgi:hypothetical protein
MTGTRPVSRSTSRRNALAQVTSADADSPPLTSMSSAGGSWLASVVPVTLTK